MSYLSRLFEHEILENIKIFDSFASFHATDKIVSDFLHLIAQSHSSNLESCCLILCIFSIDDHSRDQIWFHNLDNIFMSWDWFVFISSICFCSKKIIFVFKYFINRINVIEFFDDRLSSRLWWFVWCRSIKHLFEVLWTINRFQTFQNIHHYLWFNRKRRVDMISSSFESSLIMCRERDRFENDRSRI